MGIDAEGLSGKLWSAWSPQSLHPWAPPDAGRLVDLAPKQFWIKHRLVPLRVSNGEFWVAAATADVDPRVLLELREYLRLPIRVSPAAGDDVEFWVQVLFEGRAWHEALAESLKNTLEFRAAQVSAGWTIGRDVSVEDIQGAFGLAEELALETLALRAHLPQVRLQRYAVVSGHVGPLLSKDMAQQLQVVPVVVRRGFVLLASPRVPSEETRRQVENEAGLCPRYCLCTPQAFKDALRLVYEGDVDEPVLLPDETILDQLDRNGVINDAQLGGLQTLSRLTVETPLQAARRLGYATEADVTQATAELLNLLFVPDETVQVDANLAAYGSRQLWRRWRCAPLHIPGQGATLGTPCSIAEELRLAANRLTGTNMQVVLTTTGGLEAALNALPEHKSAPYLPEHHLLEASLVRATQEALSNALRDAAEAGISVAEAFYRAGAVDVEDLVEAQAIAANCPWVHLDRYAPQPGVAELIPDFWAAGERVVAFRRQGATLSVALLNGKDELPPGLDALTGLAVEPLLAVVEDVDDTLERWYKQAQTAPSEAYERFGEHLVKQGALTKTQFDDAWRSVAQSAKPFDSAVTPYVKSADLAKHMSSFLDIRIAQLELTPHMREYVDAMGQHRRQTVQHDPVHHDVARKLPHAVSTRLGAVPVRQHGTATVVAMVDPVNSVGVEELRSLLGEIELEVTERSSLELGLRRVWNLASLGERLVMSGLISQDDLRRALKVQESTGVRLGEVLVSLGQVSSTELAFFLAKQAGVPYFDLSDAIPDPDVAGLMPPPTGGRATYLPLFREPDGTVVLAVPDPISEGDLKLAAGNLGVATARQVVVTGQAFDETLDAVFRDEFHNHSASELMTRTPDQSARWVLSKGQKIGLVAGLVGFVASLAAFPVATGTAAMALTTIFYVSFSVYKFYLAYNAIAHTLEIGTTDEEVEALDDRFLPLYTILVPLYKETEVLPRLVQAIERLDYPKPKLDVKLLLEEDDTETIEFARAANLPAHFKIVVVPKGLPKGKPKACNYGLIYARGDFVVIFDAEDLPERDQLKKAVVAFNKADDRVACIQAKLNYFNRDQNLLTRWFTTEYSMWFDLFLPGLDASHAPIPLGGTSNHFRAHRLRELGAWDPYNVTEDADLGIRLFKAGLKTAVIDSTTYEEANSEIYNWIRQRSRWVKGYIQTYLVHMRNPLLLLRQLGLKDFFSFQMVVGGTFFGFLMNPVFWVLTAGWFMFHWGWIREVFPPLLFYMGAFNLYIGNFAFTYLNVAGCLRRRYYDMVKYALMTPIYWALMSVAAWKGFLQLFYAPSYWEKTKHGLYKGEIVTEGEHLKVAA